MAKIIINTDSLWRMSVKELVDTKASINQRLEENEYLTPVQRETDKEMSLQIYLVLRKKGYRADRSAHF